MIKKISALVFVVTLSLALSGCIGLLAGAGGAALWQAGKVVSEELVSMEKCVRAVEAAFKSKNITLQEKVSKMEVTQVRGRDANDTKVAVDVFSKGRKNAKIEIRYGLGQEEPARELLTAIKKRL